MARPTVLPEVSLIDAMAELLAPGEPPATSVTLAHLLGVSRKSVSSALHYLERTGRIRRAGTVRYPTGRPAILWAPQEALV